MPTAYENAVAALSPEFSPRLHEADPGPAANVINDNFTGTDATLVSAHTADSGDTWTLQPTTSGTMQIIGNRIRPTSGTQSAYYSSDVPASADYEIEFKVRCITNITAEVGVIARCNTAGTIVGYRLIYYGTFNSWFLYQGATSLGTWSETLAPGDERIAKLKVDGDQITATIAGVVRIAAQDTTITAAGRVAVEGNSGTDTTGFHIDYVQARPFKNAALADASGHGHNGTAFGEFTLGANGFAVGEGSLSTLDIPQKGGWAKFPGYTPFAPSTDRTFCGTNIIDPTATGIAALVGSTGSGGTNTETVIEAVSAGGSYTQINYNSNVGIMGIFGSMVWNPILPINAWFHWALTVHDDGANQTVGLFINGVARAPSVGTTQVAWGAGAGDFLIGMRGDSTIDHVTAHALKGQHGMPAVYNSILTPSQIYGLASAANLQAAQASNRQLQGVG